MSVVIAILLILMTAGVSLMNGTGAQARRAGTDMLTGMIEQARTTAITTKHLNRWIHLSDFREAGRGLRWLGGVNSVSGPTELSATTFRGYCFEVLTLTKSIVQV